MNKYENTLVAISCDLRKKLKYSHKLDTAKYIGEFLSEPKYQLVFDDLENVVILNGNNSVTFEVYLVDYILMKEIETLKLYYGLNIPSNETEKKLIKTPYGNSIIFIDKYTKIKADNMIKDHDYADYIKYNKTKK